MRVMALLAAMAAMLCLETPASEAGTYGDAPWCAVTNTGAGQVDSNCQFDTFEACVPNVLGGNRGFCSRNPYWTGSAPRAWHAKRPARRHVQQY